MDSSHDESVERVVVTEEVDRATEREPQPPPIPVGRPTGGATSANPAGLDDPANANAYQGKPVVGDG